MMSDGTTSVRRSRLAVPTPAHVLPSLSRRPDLWPQPCSAIQSRCWPEISYPQACEWRAPPPTALEGHLRFSGGNMLFQEILSHWDCRHLGPEANGAVSGSPTFLGTLSAGVHRDHLSPSPEASESITPLKVTRVELCRVHQLVCRRASPSQPLRACRAFWKLPCHLKVAWNL